VTAATTPAELEARLLATGAEKADAAQHRLPQFYLKSWAGRSGKLRLLDPATGKSEHQPPKKAFAEDGYYTVRLGENDEPNALIEELYAMIENDAAPAHRRLVAGSSPAELTIKERIYYAGFLAAQVTRGENFREADRRFADESGKAMIRLRLAHWDEIRAAAFARGDEPPPELSAEGRQLAAEGQYSVEHSPELTAHLSLAAVPELSYLLADFAWHAVHFDEPCLLTSEHPVSYWRPPEQARVMMGGIGPMTAQEVRVPLSPTVALVLVNPAFFPHKDRRVMAVARPRRRSTGGPGSFSRSELW
jgi:hypothetical protein